ncbi:hypothetical protein [Halorubrum laminariae]|uniref:Restriction endonuclease type IV Mrr domain-containing protein n=1 Tax=Halorubrum laminariae TaxID=1433523 RepID=A0ABD6C5B2_9EURY|nr:hypothetical protein [Halorubrum laminariae]
MEDIDSHIEEDVTAGLIEHFEAGGWTTATERFSDDGSGRIDLLVEHPAIGRIGIEIKTLHGYSGRSYADGIAQLLRYRELEFDGEPLDYWAFDPVVENRRRLGSHGGPDFKQFQDLMQAMANRLGFGYLNHFSEELVFRASHSRLAIPVADPETVSAEMLTSIDGLVTKRNEELPGKQGDAR